MNLTMTLALLALGFVTFTPGQVGNKTPQQKDEKPIQLQATATPATLDFGDQVIQTASKSLKVTLTNNTGKPIEISSVDTSGEDFVVDTDSYEDDCAEETIEAGKSCNIRVVFFPL